MVNQQLDRRLRDIPVESRKLLCVILRQAFRGSLRTKEVGIATLPEVHEACGLDVDGMYSSLRQLIDRGVIEMTGEYPFEEIRLVGPDITTLFEHCDAHEIPIESIFVDLQFERLGT